MSKLSPLQQKFYELMKHDMLNSDLPSFIPGFDEDNMKAFLADLKKDISTMDAVDLRRNIKALKETE